MKRNPKGYGSIYKLSGNRSQPYAVSITHGSDAGKQIRKIIGYAETKEEGENMLYIYHLDLLNYIPKIVLDNPRLELKFLSFMKEMVANKIIPSDPRKIKNIDLIDTIFKTRISADEVMQNSAQQFTLLTGNHKMLTVKEIWEIVLEKELSLSARTIPPYRSAFNLISSLHDIPINKVNLEMVENAFGTLMDKKYGYYTLSRIKSIMGEIFLYAEKHEMISKNFIHFIKIKGDKDTNKKEIFSNSQIKRLIERNDFTSTIVLICIFTGMRPGEIVDVKTSNVYIDEKYLVGGIKTAAGIDRVIPLHNFIIPYVKKLLKNNKSGFLVSVDGAKVNYHSYLSTYFKKLKKEEGYPQNLTPHSGRKTFITLGKECGMDDFYKKCIVGHSHKDLTDDIYTKPRIERLLEEVNKIKIEDIC